MLSIGIVGCDVMSVESGAAPLDVSIQFQVDPTSPELAATIAAADRVWLSIETPAGASRDTLILIRNEGLAARARVRLSPEEAVSGLRVGAELRILSTPLFRGEAVLSGGPAGLGANDFTVSPVPWSISAPVASLGYDRYGESADLTSPILFANGDAIPGWTATWTSDDTSIVEVTPDGTATSRGNGSTVLTGTFGSLRLSIPATVQQIAHWRDFGIAPADTVLTVGDVFQFRPTGVDANGYPLEIGTPFSWGVYLPGTRTLDTSQAVVSVDQDGFVTALGPGDAVIGVRRWPPICCWLRSVGVTVTN